jgi:hypothetical protein
MKYLKEISEEKIKEYNEFLKKNDYVLIKDILTQKSIDYFNKNIKFGDNLCNVQFGRCHNLKDESQNICDDYHKESFNLYKTILGYEYYITYTFALLYNKNNILIPHLDNIENEISATTCYHTTKDYPIYISKQYMENNYNYRYTDDINNIKEEDKIEINIQVGDIGFFNGRNHLHFRNKLEEDINYKGILSHYSKTKRDSEEWKQKTRENVPFLNSVTGPLYNRQFF